MQLEKYETEARDIKLVPDIKKTVKENKEEIKVYIINDTKIKEDIFILKDLTDNERDIILSGCLIYYYKKWHLKFSDAIFL